MQSSTQKKNEVKFGSKNSFNSKSRDNYFKKLEIALRNLSIIDRKDVVEKFLVRN